MAINVATFTRSAIFVLTQTQKIAGGKISGFEKKPFKRQNSPDPNVFSFGIDR